MELTPTARGSHELRATTLTSQNKTGIVDSTSPKFCLSPLAPGGKTSCIVALALLHHFREEGVSIYKITETGAFGPQADDVGLSGGDDILGIGESPSYQGEQASRM